ncbi:RNA polymerase sigma factor [Mucilaginibacter defluvii]|uniref:RNA polymerase sigma-70 factor n=1 Tax=Mucilaginibacter defluvii TaxID=1196019 RepID=A0ABP9FL89_9SPHI
MITDEAELIQLLNAKDQRAFAIVYDLFWGTLYIQAFKVLKDEDAAKDVVQEVFVGVWNSRAPIQGNLSGYLYASTRFKTLNYIRNHKTQSDYVDLFGLYIADHSNDVLDHVLEKELEETIEMMISKLPAKMREVFELSRKEHLSHKEIATLLGISEGTVKRQTSNALRLLRTGLSDIGYILLAVMLKHLT